MMAAGGKEHLMKKLAGFRPIMSRSIKLQVHLCKVSALAIQVLTFLTYDKDNKDVVRDVVRIFN